MITLKTLAQATEQEVFNQIVNHLLTQNRQSLDGDNNCAYRNEEGHKCAAGCLIADDEYDASMEGTLYMHVIEGWKYKKTHQVLIAGFQSIHDMYDVHEWPGKFKEVAEQYKLEMPPLLVERLAAQIVY